MVTRAVGITNFAVCLAILIGHTRNGWPFWPTDAIAVSLNAWVALSYTAVAWLLIERRNGGAIGPVLLVVGALYAWAGLADLYLAPLFQAGHIAPPGADYAALVMRAVGYPISFGFAAAMILFPRGRLPSRVWVVILIAGGVAAVLGVSGYAFGSSTFAPVYPSLDSPFAIPAFPKRRLVEIGDMGGNVMMGAAVIAVLLRWRGGDRTVRAQTTWVLAATVVMAVTAMIDRFDTRTWDWLNWWISIAAGLGVSLVPIAMAVAVTRYHLYDIDRIVSRTITYGVVTAILFGVLGLVNLGLQVLIGGSTGNPPVVVAASTLAVAVTFNPVRTRVQAVVDRRFNRARYDAEQTVTTFARRLRDQLDLPALTHDLQRATAEAVEPSTTTVWLRARVDRP